MNYNKISSKSCFMNTKIPSYVIIPVDSEHTSIDLWIMMKN